MKPQEVPHAFSPIPFHNDAGEVSVWTDWCSFHPDLLAALSRGDEDVGVCAKLEPDPVHHRCVHCGDGTDAEDPSAQLCRMCEKAGRGGA